MSKDEPGVYTHRRCWNNPLVDPQSDRTVRWNGQRIGRVHYDKNRPSSAVWSWHCHFGGVILDHSGTAATMAEALEEVRMRHKREGCPSGPPTPPKRTGPPKRPGPVRG